MTKSGKIIFFIIVLIIGLIIVNQFIDARKFEQQEAEAYVYSVCQNTRTNPTISELACANAQDDTGLTYRCEQRNQSINTHCWVEE